MKKAKLIKRETPNKIKPSEEYSIKSMLKIVVVLALIFLSFYGITSIIIKNKKIEEEKTPAVVDSSKIIISQLLNRNEEEYYVIATKSSLYDSSYIDTNYNEFYTNYINEYKQKENSLAFYYIDLDSALNKSYFGEDMNITDEVEKIKLNDEVLFKIKDSKIEKTYIGREKILDKLSRL